MHKKQLELKGIYVVLAALFLVFLFMPVAMLLYKSFESGTSLTLQHYRDLIFSGKFVNAFGNSFTVSGISALVTTLLAFLMAYTINYTNVSQRLKKGIRSIATLPMLLPTITYGFAIIYTFGKQGLLSKLLHVQLFDIYGFNGLLIGYVIYTLPIAFLLVNNTMKFRREALLDDRPVTDDSNPCGSLSSGILSELYRLWYPGGRWWRVCGCRNHAVQ